MWIWWIEEWEQWMYYICLVPLGYWKVDSDNHTFTVRMCVCVCEYRRRFGWRLSSMNACAYQKNIINKLRRVRSGRPIPKRGLSFSPNIALRKPFVRTIEGETTMNQPNNNLLFTNIYDVQYTHTRQYQPMYVQCTRTCITDWVKSHIMWERKSKYSSGEIEHT